MLLRIAAGLLGLFNTANGLRMVLAPLAWYSITPGVTATGPYNPHFVIDVGLAYLVGGIAFLAFAWRPRLRLVALGASGFLVMHGLFHLSHALHGPLATAGVDVGVAIPALLGLALCWPRREAAA